MRISKRPLKRLAIAGTALRWVRRIHIQALTSHSLTFAARCDSSSCGLKNSRRPQYNHSAVVVGWDAVGEFIDGSQKILHEFSGVDAAF